MPGAFLDGVSSKLADSWLAQLFTPAFGFWSVGVLAWLYSTGWSTGFGRLYRFAKSLDEGAFLGVVVVALLLVVASGALITRLSLPLLRAIEGYWPRGLSRVRARLVARKVKRLGKLDAEWQSLGPQVDAGTASALQRDRFAHLDELLRRVPAVNEMMPTRLGNILRASERRVRSKYGLEPILVWRHIGLVLSGDQQTELKAVRSGLDNAAGVCAWSALISVWTFWAWWAAPAAAVLAVLGYRTMLIPAAADWADEVEAVFDLYRNELYRSLRLPLPVSPHADRQLGERVNAYLLRGSDSSDELFRAAEG